MDGAGVMRDVMGIVWRDLRTLAGSWSSWRAARSTVMAGRTHAQPGAPMSFGWKAASWADEVGRHLDRLDEGRRRWLVGQLGGAVGRSASSARRPAPASGVLRAARSRRSGHQPG